MHPVSVIMVACNGADRTGNAIRSVQSADGVLGLDSGSVDGAQDLSRAKRLGVEFGCGARDVLGYPWSRRSVDEMEPIASRPIVIRFRAWEKKGG